MLPELAANKDVTLAGPVPAIYGAGVDFSAGLVTESEQAKSLILFLTAPETRALWRANGLDSAAH